MFRTPKIFNKFKFVDFNLQLRGCCCYLVKTLLITRVGKYQQYWVNTLTCKRFQLITDKKVRHCVSVLVKCGEVQIQFCKIPICELFVYTEWSVY